MLFTLAILFLLFGRHRYWGGYGYPCGYGGYGYNGYGNYGYGYNSYGANGYGVPYGAYSPYPLYFRKPCYGYYRPHRWWW